MIGSDASPQPSWPGLNRRQFLAGSLAAAGSLGSCFCRAEDATAPAQVAISLDLEMSAQFPRPGMTEWNFEKGNLDADTKAYAREAARRVKAKGGIIHFFALGRTMEQENVEWLREIVEEGHPVGNHTYDHVNVWATRLEDIQFRFKRAPWLIANRVPADVIRENIRLAERALDQRLGLKVRGFRTPGGFHNGLREHPHLQQMLLEQEYRWVSSLYPLHEFGQPGESPGPEVFRSILAAQAQAQPFVYPSGLIEVPCNPISDVGAFRVGRWPLDAFLEATRQGVQWAIDNRAAFDFLAHPSCLVVADPQFKTIDLICDLVRAAGAAARIVDLDQIAQRTAERAKPASP